MIKTVIEQQAVIIIRKDGQEIAHLNVELLHGTIIKEKFNDIIITSNSLETIVELEV